MRNKVIFGMTLLFIGFLILGCDTRRDLLDETTTKVKFTIEWPSSIERPNGASVYFYPTTGGKPRVVLTNELKDSIYLPAGTYQILVINETEKSHDYLNFKNTNLFESFEVYADPLTIPEPYDQYVHDNPIYILSPLYSTQVSDLIVSTDELKHRKTIEVLLKPTSKLCRMQLKVHVQGLVNSATDELGFSLDGFACGIWLSQDKITDQKGDHFAYFDKRVLNADNQKNGYLESNFLFFGFASLDSKSESSPKLNLTIYLHLRNGKEFIVPTHEVDLIQLQNDELDEPQYLIETGLDDLITLPEVPNPPPSGSSGFDAEVSDWGPVEHIETPVLE